MSAKSDGFPSLPFQDIKEKQKRHRRTDTRMDGRMDGQCKNSIPPPPTNIVCWGIIITAMEIGSGKSGNAANNDRNSIYQPL